MSAHRFAISINHNIVDKPSERRFHGTGFEPHELTIDELKDEIQNGFAFTAHFKDGSRKKAHFIRAGFLAADFDGGVTLEECMEVPLVRDHASLIYTTHSHTPDEPRFRIVFILEQEIVDGDLWALALKGLAHTLGSDMAATDAARLFYGNQRAEISGLNGVLPASEVERLIEFARELAPKRPQHLSDAAISRIGILKRDQEVQTAQGLVRIGDITEKIAVSCPFHLDRHPSAVVFPDARSGPRLYCHACATTYFCEPPEPYDFERFDTLFAERLKADKQRTAEYEAEYDQLDFWDCVPPKPTCFEYRQTYLPRIEYAPGLTLVKSPKGSGKTLALAWMLSSMIDRPSRFRPRSVMLIGHRRTLVREAARRLGLDCYLADDDTKVPPSGRFAVCLDSISWAMDVRRVPYDLIILDESEQVFSHLFSETIEQQKGGRTMCFAALDWFIRSAKAVVALDADLSLITTYALRSARAKEWETARLIYNHGTNAAAGRAIEVFPSQGSLMQDLLASVGAGKRVFVACNSKEMANRVCHLLRSKCSIEPVLVTSDTSGRAEVVEFLDDITTRYLDVQALVASPSLGTGIDISFPNGEAKVDVAYGFFSPHVNKHTDADQHLSRVRNPGAVRVWVDNRSLDFDVDFEAIRHQLAVAGAVPAAFRGYADDGTPDVDWDNRLLNLHARLLVSQRASMRDFGRLFRDLRRKNGWKIIEATSSDEKTGRDLIRQAKEAVQKARADALFEARDLSEDERANILRHSKRGKVSENDKLALEKHELVHALGRPLTPEIAIQAAAGRFLARLATFRGLCDTVQWPFPLSPDKPLPWRCSDGVLVFNACRAAGLHDGKELLANAEISQSQLSDFVEFCTTNKLLIEERTTRPVRTDVAKRAIMQLNAILKLAGISVTTSSRTRAKGKHELFYRLDRDQLKMMMDLAMSPAHTEEEYKLS